MTQNERAMSERDAELEERNEELEAQHEELTAAVEAVISKNEKLERTISELNNRNKELEKIVYRSAHDLKTPICSIEGLLKLIRLDPTNQEEYTSQSFRSLEQLKVILKLLGAYAEILQGEVDRQEINLRSFWDDLKMDLNNLPLMSADRVKVIFKLTTVVSDYDKLKMLVFQLVKNGLENSDNTPVEVVFSRTADHYHIQITDYGVGITEKDHDRLFEMFYRSSTRSNGQGLGLFFCKRIVDLFSGKIKIFGTENIGTIIKIQFPIDS